VKLPARFGSFLLLFLLGGAVGAGVGWYFGDRQGKQAGYQIGLRHGQVKAARQGPPQVVDRAVGLAALQGTDAWGGLGPELSSDAAFAAFLNEAPSPCGRQARRGISLASALVAPDDCATLAAQLAFAGSVYRTFSDDPGEALAALRVEARVAPAVDGRQSKGGDGVVVVEYADFQCPYCTRAQRLTNGLLEERPEIRLVFKHMPLSFHPAARPAALAAEAAAEQGKFWAMHDALFDLGKAVGDGIDKGWTLPESGPVPFEEQATAVGLDLERYRADFRSDALADRIDDDLEEARALGVTGTPTFIIGGRKVTERPSVAMFAKLVDKAEAEAEGRFSWGLEPPPAGVEPAEDADEAPAPAAP